MQLLRIKAGHYELAGIKLFFSKYRDAKQKFLQLQILRVEQLARFDRDLWILELLFKFGLVYGQLVYNSFFDLQFHMAIITELDMLESKWPNEQSLVEELTPENILSGFVPQYSHTCYDHVTFPVTSCECKIC